MQIHHFPWTEEDQHIKHVARVSTMLHPGEVRLLHWLGREHYQGWGEIVDAGCFVGGSTAALGWGLQQNAKARPGCLHVYDRFEIDPYMRVHAPTMQIMGGARTDAEFFAQWEKNTAGLESLITLHRGDINQGTWTGGPIEICFLDILKTWEILHWTAGNLYRALQSESVVVHQDFYDVWSYFIPLSMAHLAHYFERIARIEWSDVIFRLHETIPAELLQTDLRSIYSLDEALALHRSNGLGCNRLEIGQLEVQAVSLAMSWGDPEQARAIHAGLVKNYDDLLRIRYNAMELNKAYFTSES